MLGVQAQVQTLEIAQSSTHVSDFVYRGGFVQGRTASQEEHYNKQACSDCAVRVSPHIWAGLILTASREARIRRRVLPDAEFDVVTAYRRLLARLRSRAERLGSKDPESAAQETLKRSLENPQSKSAIQYYFSENPSSGSPYPGWPLDQLLAWLHGVLHFVVREERNRVSYRREVIISGLARPWVDGESALDAADPAPD